MFGKYLVIPLVAALLTTLGSTAYYRSAYLGERAKQEAASFELSQCGNRLANLIDDIRSDNEIDNLPDSALVSVPPHWLLPPASRSGN